MHKTVKAISLILAFFLIMAICIAGLNTVNRGIKKEVAAVGNSVTLDNSLGEKLYKVQGLHPENAQSLTLVIDLRESAAPYSLLIDDLAFTHEIYLNGILVSQNADSESENFDSAYAYKIFDINEYSGTGNEVTLQIKGTGVSGITVYLAQSRIMQDKAEIRVICNTAMLFLMILMTLSALIWYTRKRDARFLLVFALIGAVSAIKAVCTGELSVIAGVLGFSAHNFAVWNSVLSAANLFMPLAVMVYLLNIEIDRRLKAAFLALGLVLTVITGVMSSPGRLYLGITTAGRTASYIYQAIVSSLLQAAADPSFAKEEEDHYWTLVGYFNSLRELGSASIIMQDDVKHSLELVSARRQETPRHLQPPSELTSRVKSDEIREKLLELDASRDTGEAADVVLASNMISVGLDVGRLGLMLVNGQPKTIAEYIQATSRVGRGKVPGLVVTLYNANKSRDRSRYETFPTWHGALYRDVEATGVTPFAPRARDKALHAPFVAMARHLVPGLLNSPADAAAHQAELDALIDLICARISSVDPDEAAAARQELCEFLKLWHRRGALAKYWDNWSDDALLVSADAQATSNASGFSKGLARATPGTLRAVEPSTGFVIKEIVSSEAEDIQ